MIQMGAAPARMSHPVDPVHLCSPRKKISLPPRPASLSYRQRRINMTAKSNGQRVHPLLLGVSLMMALANLANPAAAQPQAPQPSADASKAKPAGGTLLWASSGTQEGGKSVGQVLYSLAVDSTGVYVIGDKRGGAIIEKLNPADGKPVWKNY